MKLFPVLNMVCTITKRFSSLFTLILVELTSYLDSWCFCCRLFCTFYYNFGVAVALATFMVVMVFNLNIVVSSIMFLDCMKMAILSYVSGSTCTTFYQSFSSHGRPSFYFSINAIDFPFFGVLPPRNCIQIVSVLGTARMCKIGIVLFRFVLWQFIFWCPWGDWSWLSTRGRLPTNPSMEGLGRKIHRLEVVS